MGKKMTKKEQEMYRVLFPERQICIKRDTYKNGNTRLLDGDSVLTEQFGIMESDFVYVRNEVAKYMIDNGLAVDTHKTYKNLKLLRIKLDAIETTEPINTFMSDRRVYGLRKKRLSNNKFNIYISDGTSMFQLNCNINNLPKDMIVIDNRFNRFVKDLIKNKILFETGARYQNYPVYRIRTHDIM